MITISKSLVFALTVAAASSASLVPAPADGATQIFKPAHGVSFDVGSKRASAYYVAGDHACDLTVMLADRPDADGHVTGTTTRMNVPVAAGSRSRIRTTDGAALEVSCSIARTVMTVRPVDETAAVMK